MPFKWKTSFCLSTREITQIVRLDDMHVVLNAYILTINILATFFMVWSHWQDCWVSFEQFALMKIKPPAVKTKFCPFSPPIYWFLYLCVTAVRLPRKLGLSISVVVIFLCTGLEKNIFVFSKPTKSFAGAKERKIPWLFTMTVCRVIVSVGSSLRRENVDDWVRA